MDFNKVKFELMLLIHGSSDISAMNYDIEPAGNTADHEGPMHRAIAKLKERRPIEERFNRLQTQDKKILCAWVASQACNEHITMYFGELSWIAVHEFQGKFDALANLCRNYMHDQTAIIRTLIEALKEKSQAKLLAAIREYLK